MAISLNKLSARAVATARKSGRLSDGGGLYLQISPSGAKSWLFIFKKDGRQREMGLGGLNSLPLASARQQAAEAREILARGGDPLAEKRAQRTTVPTFGKAADALIQAHEGSWRNEKHRAQWKMTLREYAVALRPLPVNKITTEDVLAALKPIWLTKPETASRVRGRIEAVLTAATVRGHRSGPNPAQWRNHLDHLLPKRPKLSRGHHAAMAYAEVPAFLELVREMKGSSARALEFTVLTAARSGETMGATWPEIDLERKVWTVPAGRMKAGREHRVPLSTPAVRILEEMALLRTTGGFVFPGQLRGKGLSVMALEMVLRRLKVENATVHGFRSSFRDWAGEETSVPREVAEQALAHAVGSKVEQAYRRGDALEKRRKLMDAWATYLTPATSGNVVAVPARQARHG
ncbi:tyrosine-type recombinase/integrase [Alsobacter metallidurans]|nr:site-specific integrase [Alsobacter metallidurans]